uniref:Uncharacterized protein n=1 Tax=Amphimedon queenslandica TaxID=400682 RepID=A0A1X7TS90_AMPQE
MRFEPSPPYVQMGEAPIGGQAPYWLYKLLLKETLFVHKERVRKIVQYEREVHLLLVYKERVRKIVQYKRGVHQLLVHKERIRKIQYRREVYQLLVHKEKVRKKVQYKREVHHLFVRKERFFGESQKDFTLLIHKDWVRKILQGKREVHQIVSERLYSSAPDNYSYTMRESERFYTRVDNYLGRVSNVPIICHTTALTSKQREGLKDSTIQEECTSYS